MELNGGVFLEQATSWKLDEAIQLFFVGNDGGQVTSSHSPPAEDTNYLAYQNAG
jgi:hypothetical protein